MFPNTSNTKQQAKPETKVKKPQGRLSESGVQALPQRLVIEGTWTVRGIPRVSHAFLPRTSSAVTFSGYSYILLSEGAFLLNQFISFI